MKGERQLDWAMRIDAESYLANLQSLKPQEMKFMKLCQGLKSEDRLYEKITEIEGRSIPHTQEVEIYQESEEEPTREATPTEFWRRHGERSRWKQMKNIR